MLSYILRIIEFVIYQLYTDCITKTKHVKISLCRFFKWKYKKKKINVRSHVPLNHET